VELLTLEPEKKGLKDKGAQWNEMSDETVLLLSISENPEAFSLIVARYRDAFLRKAKTILRDEAEAQDAVQEAFVKLYIKGGRFKSVEGASFSSWAYKVLINTCLSAYRKRSSRKDVYALEELAEFLPDAASDREKESALSYDAFLSVVSRLPRQFSALLKKLVLFGRDPHEIALEEGVSVGAIRTRLHRARKAFEKVRPNVEGGSTEISRFHVRVETDKL